jgi:hypothetical protein
MPTILGPKLHPDWAGRPARMSSEDFDIWRRYWPAHKAGALAMWFDVGLGLPDHLPAAEDAEQLLGWIRNTQKRADVIVERAERVEVIELRFNTTANVVGRLEAYLMLLGDDNPFAKPLAGVVVSNRYDGELFRLCSLRGFAFEVA